MDSKKPSDILRKLISTDEIEDAILELSSYLPQMDAISIISSRFHSMEKERHLGSLTADNYTARRTKLAQSLLDLIKNNESEIDNSTNLKHYSFKVNKKNLKRRLEEQLIHQYENIETLGSGNSAYLFKAYEKYLNRYVAIKVLKDPNLINIDLQKNERINLELKRAATYKHRNIMTLYSANFYAEPKYIVLEYVEGVALNAITKKVGKLPLTQTMEVLYYLADALYYGHQRNFLHRSVRPNNILIDLDGMPVLSPFQLIRASVVQKAIQQSKEDYLYWSPEQIEEKKVDGKSDQFSLGLVAYEMLCGTSLFKGSKVHNIYESRDKILSDPSIIQKRLARHRCPEGLKGLVVKMLARDPNDRWDNLKEVFDQLDKLLVETKLTEEFKIVNESYKRCRDRPLFFVSFYNKFFSKYKSPKREIVEGLFKNKDTQYKILNHAIIHLLEQRDLKGTVKILIKRHQFENYQVTYEDYLKFTDSLIEQIVQVDNKCQKDNEIENAWRNVIGKFHFILKKELEK